MNIDEKLEQARRNSKGYGEKYGAKETADDYLKATYAMLYEDAPGGSVAERDAWVRRQSDYRAAIERKKTAYTDWKVAETYLKLLLVEAEVWRTQCANDRLMDQGHR